MNELNISPSKLAASYRERILESCETGKADDDNVRSSIFHNLDIKAQTGQLIRAARSDLNKSDFAYATDFLEPRAIKQYEAIADFVANQENRSLESAIREIQGALTLTGSIQGSNGLGQQKLHESNFHSQWVRIKQSGMGLFNHELQRRSLRLWHTEELFDFLANVEPFVKIRDDVKEELSNRTDAPSGHRQ